MSFLFVFVLLCFLLHSRRTGISLFFQGFLSKKRRILLIRRFRIHLKRSLKRFSKRKINECDFQDNFYSFYKFNNAIYGQTNDHQMFEMTSGMGSPPSVTAKITESDLTNCFNNLIELSSQNTLKSILKKP